jgi:PAS domain S-box-containing protein
MKDNGKTKKHVTKEPEALRQGVGVVERLTEEQRWVLENWHDSFNTLENVMLIIDKDYNIESINEHGLELLGKSKDEIIGQKCYQAIHGEDKPVQCCPLRQALTTDKVQSVERYEELSGRLFYMRYSPIPDNHGEVTRYSVLMRDTTGYKPIEDLLKTVSINSPVGVYIVQDGKFCFVNRQFLEDTGYSEDELLGTDPQQIVMPEYRNMVRDNAVNMLKSKRSSPYEYRTVNKNGDARWALETVVPIRYKGRQATLGNYMDITEHKRMEIALRESEEFNSSLLNNSPYPVLVLNSDTSIKYVNPALEKLTGFTSAELVGIKAPYPWLTQESLPKTRRQFKIAMQRGPQWFAELFQKKNGEYFWVEIRSTPVTYDGKFRYYMSSWVDITDRKQIEDALRREKERAERYLNVAGVMLATVNVDEKITLMNKKGCEILGYQAGELTSSNWFTTLVPERIRAEMKSVFRKLIAGENGPVIYYENPLLTRDGEERLIAFNNSVVKDTDGRVIGVLISGEDVTELRKTQEQLQHSRLLASLGEMTAGIAHEVNNPLGCILLYSELLASSDVPSQMKKDLKVIHEEAKRATKIMTDLLTYGRRTKSQMRRLNLYNPLKKVLEMRRYEQKVQNVTVSTNLVDSPLYINGDSSQLMQVFMNLMLNAEEALKASNGGNIIITTETNDEWARVQIADDGPGIPQKNLNQVFYPFFTTKEIGEGTGLGLSTCYGIITGHDGLIRAENNEMGGATFTIELPLARTQKNGNSPKRRKGRFGNNMAATSKVGGSYGKKKSSNPGR